MHKDLLHYTILVKSILLYIIATWWFFTNLGHICNNLLFSDKQPDPVFAFHWKTHCIFTIKPFYEQHTSWNWKTWFHFPQLYLKNTDFVFITERNLITPILKATNNLLHKSSFIIFKRSVHVKKKKTAEFVHV